ncbi:MAG: cation transporter [Elusimicrobia bacterium]|nr:cation transporter [Elusimicrobiota bacterium]
MDSNSKKVNIVKLSVFSNSFLVVSKLIIGIIIGSVSVISEAIHSAIDLVAALIAFFAVKNSNKPPDEEHRFGHGKIENISGFIEAILIFIAAVWIIYEAVKKLIYPGNIEQIGWGILVMFVSSALNFYVSRKLMKTALETDSIAIKADAVHLMTDVYTSLGVAVSLFIIWIMEYIFKGNHFHWLDPLCAIGVALLIFKAAWDLTKESFKDLMDSSLDKEEISKIKSAIDSLEISVGYKSLKTRKSGNEKFVEMDLVFPKEVSLLKAHEETDKLTASIKEKIPNSHVIVHMEPCLDPCPKSCEPNCKKNA